VAETINLDAPIVAMDWRPEQRWGQTVSVWNVPETEAGWHANSARPGQNSNVVISGHNNSSGGHVFGTLDRLAVGEQITIRTGQESFSYKVSHKQIVRTFGASRETLAYLRAVTQPTRQEQLTLITCWPNWTNTHRLIVIARPVPS
jgi:sortase A